MVSHRSLRTRRRLPRARCRWALDSGGFTELSLYGRWQTSLGAYADAVARYAAEIGGLAWASPQDWMCEPAMLARTGLTVDQHQALTTGRGAYSKYGNAGYLGSPQRVRGAVVGTG